MQSYDDFFRTLVLRQTFVFRNLSTAPVLRCAAFFLSKLHFMAISWFQSRVFLLFYQIFKVFQQWYFQVLLWGMSCPNWEKLRRNRENSIICIVIVGVDDINLFFAFDGTSVVDRIVLLTSLLFCMACCHRIRMWFPPINTLERVSYNPTFGDFLALRPIQRDKKPILNRP